MPDLVIRIKKNRDGTAALNCERPDGTVTWQRHRGAHGQFFALHDLTHYAVETTLAARDGFFGLVADGWQVTDFGAPWPKGPFPAEAVRVELIVGMLDAERTGGKDWSADEFNEQARRFCVEHASGEWTPLEDNELSSIRHARQALFAQWTAVPTGEALELTYDRPAHV